MAYKMNKNICSFFPDSVFLEIYLYRMVGIPLQDGASGIDWGSFF